MRLFNHIIAAYAACISTLPILSNAVPFEPGFPFMNYPGKIPQPLSHLNATSWHTATLVDDNTIFIHGCIVHDARYLACNTTVYSVFVDDLDLVMSGKARWNDIGSFSNFEKSFGFASGAFTIPSSAGNTTSIVSCGTFSDTSAYPMTCSTYDTYTYNTTSTVPINGTLNIFHMAYTLSRDGVMYMIGGSDMSITFVPTFSILSVVNNVPQVQIISNITNDMFNSTAGPLVGHTATLIGNHVYVIGGRWYHHPIVTFDIDTGEQTILISNFGPNVDRNVSNLNGHTATYVNNKLYVYGGMVALDSRNVASNTMYILDFNDPCGVPTWSSNNGAPDARAFHTATLLPNNVIMYIYGKSSIDDPIFNSYTLYDTRNNTWSGPFLPTPPNLFSLSISPHISAPPVKGGANAALIGGICGGVAVLLLLIGVKLFLDYRRRNSSLSI